MADRYPWRPYRRRPSPIVQAFYNGARYRYLQTPQGPLRAGPGDVVVRDSPEGPWRVVAEAIFESLYQPVEE
jgi:hypothetical protein